MSQAYLSRQIELAVEGLYIVNGIARNQLLVKPDLVVGRSAGKQMLAHSLRKLISLTVKLRKRGDSRDDNIPGIP